MTINKMTEKGMSNYSRKTDILYLCIRALVKFHPMDLCPWNFHNNKW